MSVEKSLKHTENIYKKNEKKITIYPTDSSLLRKSGLFNYTREILHQIIVNMNL